MSTTEDILQPARAFNLKAALLINRLGAVLPILKASADSPDVVRLLDSVEAAMLDAIDAHRAAGGGNP